MLYSLLLLMDLLIVSAWSVLFAFFLRSCIRLSVVCGCISLSNGSGRMNGVVRECF